MTTARSRLGQAGEDAACARLEALGYRMLARNYRTRLGEVDVIAEDGDELAFIEVKTRTGLKHGLPCEAVDRRKRRRMTRAAVQYLTEHSLERPWRFDVVEVVILAGAAPEIRVLRHAFEPEEKDLRDLE